MRENGKSGAVFPPALTPSGQMRALPEWQLAQWKVWPRFGWILPDSHEISVNDERFHTAAPGASSL